MPQTDVQQGSIQAQNGESLLLDFKREREVPHTHMLVWRWRDGSVVFVAFPENLSLAPSTHV